MHVTTSVSVFINCASVVSRVYHCDWPNSMAMTALVVGQRSRAAAPFSPYESVMMAFKIAAYSFLSWITCCFCSSVRFVNSRLTRVSLYFSLKLKATKA
ncbi:hypothetical protein D3C76_1531100 [compost metagenome]